MFAGVLATSLYLLESAGLSQTHHYFHHVKNLEILEADHHPRNSTESDLGYSPK